MDQLSLLQGSYIMLYFYFTLKEISALSLMSFVKMLVAWLFVSVASLLEEIYHRTSMNKERLTSYLHICSRSGI